MKFSVGDHVMVKSKRDPRFNSPFETIEWIGQSTGRDSVTGKKSSGSRAVLVGQPKYYFQEDELVLIPPTEGTTWEKCAWAPNQTKIKETADV